jgi:hypothetical protein
MADYLIHAPDLDALHKYAATLGPDFWDEGDEKSGRAPGIRQNGRLPGGGNYCVAFATDSAPTGATVKDSFGNEVPERAPLPGVWVRVRLNGENLFALGALPMPPETMTVYPPTGSEGTTKGYVQPSYGAIL